MPNALIKSVIPSHVRCWLRAQQRRWTSRPPVGWVRWGSFGQLRPISRVFGLDRGQPIDRYYIEKFLSLHSQDIQGHVLEIGDDSYTRKFGGQRVTRSDVFHAKEGDPKATIVGDLTDATHIHSNTFDCIIFTQTLQFVYDVPATLNTLHRILNPGGILLATFPGISQISRYDMDRWGDYWRFTTLSSKRLFEKVFPAANVRVESHGNVRVAVAFLHGLATEELTQRELDYHDADYEVLITVQAVKPLKE